MLQAQSAVSDACGASPSWEMHSGLARSWIPRRQGWEGLTRSARSPSCPQTKEKEHLEQKRKKAQGLQVPAFPFDTICACLGFTDPEH